MFIYEVLDFISVNFMYGYLFYELSWIFIEVIVLYLDI